MSFRAHWLLSILLVFVTTMPLAGQSAAQIPDYMYPVINDAGRMSIAAYGNDKQLVETLRQEGWGIPKLIDFPSGLHVGVWERSLPGGNRERVVAFVGTKDVAGVAADLSQGAVGPAMTAQYRDGLDFALRQVSEKDRDPRLTVTFTGHSLGGSIGERVNLETGVRTVVFNAAPLNGLDSLLAKDRAGQASVAASDLWNLRTRGDIVSALPLAKQYGRELTFDAVRPTTGQWTGNYSTHGVEAILDSIKATRTNALQSSQISRSFAPGVGFSGVASSVNGVRSVAGAGAGSISSVPLFKRFDFGTNARKTSVYDNDWSWAAIGAGTSGVLRGPLVTNAAGQFEFLQTSLSGRVVNVNRWGTWLGGATGKRLGDASVVVGAFSDFRRVFAENKVGSDAFYKAYIKTGANTSASILGTHIGVALGVDTGPLAGLFMPLLAYAGGKAGDVVDWASASYGAASYGAPARARIVDQWSWAVSRGQTSSTLSDWLGGRPAALNAGFSTSEMDRYDALFRPQPNWGMSARTTSSLNFPRPHDADPGVSILDHKDWAPNIVKRPPFASLPPPSPPRPDPALLTTPGNPGSGGSGGAVGRTGGGGGGPVAISRLPSPPFPPPSNIGGVWLVNPANVSGAIPAETSKLGTGQFSLRLQDPLTGIASRELRQFVTAMWAVYFSKDGPGISINPIASGAEQQVVSYVGKVRQSDLGRVMREADYTMKKWAVGVEHPLIPNFQSVDRLTRDTGLRYFGASRRFVFVPEDMQFRQIGDAFVFESGRMTVKTGYVVQNKSVPAEASDEAFAKAFTDRYSEIEARYPIYQELFDYSKLVSLAQYIKDQHVPLLWFLMANKDLALTEDAPPETVKAIIKKSETFESATIEGGVDLAKHACQEIYSPLAASSSPVSSWALEPPSAEFAISMGTVGVSSYQTDIALRHGNEPGLELVRRFDPAVGSSGFGPGWQVLRPYDLKPASDVKISLADGRVPEKMRVENLITGHAEVLSFNRTKYATEAYVPDDPKASTLLFMSRTTDGTFRLVDKLGNEFLFDDRGRTRQVIISDDYTLEYVYNIEKAGLTVFGKVPYDLHAAAQADSPNGRTGPPARIILTDLRDSSTEGFTLDRTTSPQRVSWAPDLGSKSKFQLVVLLSNGSFSVEERDGNEIHFYHDGKFDNVTVPVLRGLRQGEERIEFEYEYREGQFRVRHAKVMQEDLSSPPYSIRYDYAPDGRLATITGPDGSVSEVHYTGSTTSITGGTPLRITEARSKKDVDEMLRQCGVSIHDAARDGDLARVQALLTLDPNLLSSRDDRGNSPLHWAAFGGHKDIAELLIANKADVNAKDNNGVTPLHDAAGLGRTDVAELLLAHQALVNARSNVGATPLHNAAGNGHRDVAALLLAHGADVNAKGDGDMTPLHNAAFAGAKDVAALLLAHRADLTARSAKGNTPLGIAKQEGQTSIEELLRQHGGRE